MQVDITKQMLTIYLLNKSISVSTVHSSFTLLLLFMNKSHFCGVVLPGTRSAILTWKQKHPQPMQIEPDGAIEKLDIKVWETKILKSSHELPARLEMLLRFDCVTL